MAIPKGWLNIAALPTPSAYPAVKLPATVVTVPVGLIMRAMGRLAFTRFAEPAVDTYWTPTEGRVHSAESYRKQF